MRYLGIDHGEKRVGMAVSDPEGRIAFPKTSIVNNRGVINEIKKLVAKEKVDQIILGLPLGLQGQETKQTAKVRAFAGKLHLVLTIPLDFENEILTTRLARAGRVKDVDASAAALILQSFLDKQNS